MTQLLHVAAGLASQAGSAMVASSTHAARVADVSTAMPAAAAVLAIEAAGPRLLVARVGEDDAPGVESGRGVALPPAQ